jgi:hypothetical protein
MVDRIDRRNSTTASAAADSTTFAPKKERSLTIGGQPVRLVSNGAVRRQPRLTGTTPPKTEEGRMLALLRDVLHEVHPALADMPVNLYRRGGPGNDHYTIRVKPNPRTGFHDFTIEYSALGQALISDFRNNRPVIQPEG